MRKQKGISLIVLVITIIVMIILAGSIILTLSNNGIIGKASEAVEESDAATVNQLAQMAWAESYAEYKSGSANLTEEALVVKLKSDVIETLKNNKINTEEYGIKVTTKGVEIVKGWLQSGIKVVKGSIELEVGDYIDYDETAGGTVALDGENVEWQILGATDKGELLILSTDNIVSDYMLGNKDFIGSPGLSFSQSAWLTAEDELDNACKSYGKGKSATGARSIRVEDINRVRGFNPAEKISYENNKEAEYGTEVNIFTDSGAYEVTNGVKGTLNSGDNGFCYYDGDKDFNTVHFPTGRDDIITIKNTGYEAFEDDTTIRINGQFDEKINTMFYGSKYEPSSTEYWLANKCVIFGSDEEEQVVYGVLAVASSNDFLYATEYLVKLWTSLGEGFYDYSGVRAVVSLDAGVTMIGNTTIDGEWKY